LPAVLRQLYTEAAGGCKCRYHWTPDKEQLSELEAVFLYEKSCCGGAEFIPSGELLETHGIHRWFDGREENLPEALARV
jgi:hypothetical protein